MVKIELFRDNQIAPIKINNNLIETYFNVKKMLRKKKNKIDFLLSNQNFYIFPMIEIALKVKTYKLEIYNTFFVINNEYYPYVFDVINNNINQITYSKFNNHYIFNQIDFPKTKELNYIGMINIDDENFDQHPRPFKPLDKKISVSQKLKKFNILFPKNKSKKIKEKLTDKYLYTKIDKEINLQKKFDIGLFFLREFNHQKQLKENDLIKRFDIIINFILNHSNKNGSFIIEYFDLLNDKSKKLLNKLVQNFESVVIESSYNLESVTGQLFIYCKKFNPTEIKVSQNYINNNIDNFNLLRINDFINKFNNIKQNINYNFNYYTEFKVPQIINYCYSNNLKINPIFKFKLDDYYLLNNKLDLVDLSDLNLVYHHIYNNINQGLYCENIIFTDFLKQNLKVFCGHYNYISTNKPDNEVSRIKYWITNKEKKLKLKERSNNWFIYIL